MLRTPVAAAAALVAAGAIALPQIALAQTAHGATSKAKLQLRTGKQDAPEIVICLGLLFDVANEAFHYTLSAKDHGNVAGCAHGADEMRMNADSGSCAARRVEDLAGDARDYAQRSHDQPVPPSQGHGAQYAREWCPLRRNNLEEQHQRDRHHRVGVRDGTGRP